jgi:hypothetical protein
MKELKDMSLNELVEYFTGRACIAIGRGDLRSEICTIITCSMQLGYDNGQKAPRPTRRRKKGA